MRRPARALLWVLVGLWTAGGYGPRLVLEAGAVEGWPTVAGEVVSAYAERAARAFRPGDPIDVRYDPDDPTHAVIETGGTLRGWLHVAFGARLVLVAALGFGRSLRG